MTTETVEVFYSYAPSEQDEDLRRQLDIHLKHLERLGLIAGWYRNKVNPGAELELEVERHFLAARVILLLVSPDFMASDYCYGSDMQRAMERHSAKQACVIPILLRPVHYKGALFEKLRVLPSNAKPITNWANLDEAFSDVARGISQVIESLTPSWQRRSVTNLSSSHDRAMWMVPHRRNPFFTGREELLINLRNNLIAMNTAALSQPQSINGLGGVGKTQIAIEYAYRHRYEYDYVLWARAATSETLIADFVMMAEFLHLFEREESDKNRVITVVKWWLATHSGWLLILDNADDLETIYDFLPKEWSGHIILTTRIQATGPFVKSIEVEPMEKKEGSLLLLRRAKVLELNETLDQAIAQDCIAAEAIVAIMGGLPLALDQAAAYIEETGCRVPTYLKRYHQRQMHLLKRRGGISSEHPEPVTMTWSLSFEKVRQASLEAADLLRLCAFLAPDAIPEELLIEGASELGSTLQPITDEPSILDEAIGVLRRFSLIHKNNQTDMLSIHRLIQTVLKEGMDEETQKLWAERAIKTVNLIFPSVEFATWSRCQKYLPHAQVCTMHIQHYKMAFPEAARLFLRVGLYLYSQAKFSEAQLNYQSALLISEQVLGEEHFDTADILDNLARLYHTQGKHSQAEQLYRRALLIREKVLGLEHSDTAISLDNLALLYSNQGRYTEAEELFLQALVVDKKILGSDHSHTAKVLNRLGLLYTTQGRYAEAEEQLLQAVALITKILGPDHPNAANILSDLAKLYRIRGRYVEAESLYKQALTTLDANLGVEHPETAFVLNNLALLYSTQGKYAEAESLYQRALSSKIALGERHPSVAAIVHNLGRLYRVQGMFGEAEGLFKQALAIREEFLGSNHPDTASSKSQLAGVYKDQGKGFEAEELFLQAIEIHEKALGSEHPNTASIFNDLALLYDYLGKYAQAELLFQKVLLTYQDAYGSDHINTATVLNNLAKVYNHQGKYAEAAILFQQALTTYENVMGSEHPLVAKILENYMDLLMNMKMEREVIDLRERIRSIRSSQNKS